MEKGDAVVIMGSIWHGAGTNITTDERRNIYSLHMVKGTYRSDENQMLAVPREVAASYDPDLQVLLGYSVSQPWCGWVELDDPIKVLSSGMEQLKNRDLNGVIFEGPGSENYKSRRPDTTSQDIPEGILIA